VSFPLVVRGGWWEPGLTVIKTFTLPIGGRQRRYSLGESIQTRLP